MISFIVRIKKRFLQPLVLAFITSFLSFSVCADEETTGLLLSELTLSELLNVKITVASGFEQPLYEAPSTVTLITEEQWQAMGVTTLAEVIETIPGIHVTLSQTALTSDVYSIRGLQAQLNSLVMVLIDGEYINASNAGVLSTCRQQS